MEHTRRKPLAEKRHLTLISLPGFPRAEFEILLLVGEVGKGGNWCPGWSLLARCCVSHGDRGFCPSCSHTSRELHSGKWWAPLHWTLLRVKITTIMCFIERGTEQFASSHFRKREKKKEKREEEEKGILRFMMIHTWASRRAHSPRSEWFLHYVSPNCVPSSKPRGPFNNSGNLQQNASHIERVDLVANKEPSANVSLDW